MSIDWKHTTRNFVLAAGTWLAITTVSMMIHGSAPQGISLASASVLVGLLLTVLSFRFRLLNKRIIWPVSGIALSAALSAIPSELGFGNLDGAAVFVSVIGIIGCVCVLLYFALTD